MLYSAYGKLATSKVLPYSVDNDFASHRFHFHCVAIVMAGTNWIGPERIYVRQSPDPELHSLTEAYGLRSILEKLNVLICTLGDRQRGE